MRSAIRKLSLAAVGLAFFACGAEPALVQEEAETESELIGRYEVWLLDQSNSAGTFGGRVYIYDGRDLNRSNPSGTVAKTVIDLGAEASALCLANTGANPVRPHMVFFNPDHTHAVISFVASGHVLIMDATSRAPVACFRTMPGTVGARQAHAAIPDPLGRFIVVANQNGKLLERIDTDWKNGQFTHNMPATIDLANCTTPNGAPCQAADVRPDNAPICPIIDAWGDYTFVTLRGGGLFVVDAAATPMEIIAEYDAATVHGNGCGGVEANGRMFLNSGGGTAANLTQFDVYDFPLEGYSSLNKPNTPAPTAIFSDNEAAFSRDAHGMVSTFFGLNVWVYDRAANRAEVFDTYTGEHINTVELSHSASADPTPDLADTGPWYLGRQFISLRGPNPLSGDPHVSTGATPGLGVLQMDFFGTGGELIAILPISNLDAMGVERADGHGLRVRRF